MKKIIFSVVILSCFAITKGIYSEEKKLGLGICLLYPTGITFKYKWDQKMSIESTLGIFQDGSYFHAGVLYDFYQINQGLKLYTGGAFLMQERVRKQKIFRGIFEERSSIYSGIRIPFGLVYYEKNDWDLFGEISLNFLAKDGLDANIGVAIGLHFYL